ncbi:acyl carrier protein [Miniphocaeibacter massiliensis]|uniref:acyl carrier protein n=1 Tax=Miniphocaeibacter massiliensis TaxID=2041841 RepID=UPI000C1BA810|nr:acyl carrier protein [Miniphocaeibacter massiliensis]
MTFDKVKEIIIENLGVDGDAVKPEAKLIEDLEADSLDAVELSMALEDEFDLQISDDEFANLSTVQDIVNYIDSNK